MRRLSAVTSDSISTQEIRRERRERTNFQADPYDQVYRRTPIVNLGASREPLGDLQTLGIR